MRETSTLVAAQWRRPPPPPRVPHFCSWVIRKSRFFSNKNPLLGTLDCTGSMLWAPFNISESTGLLF